MAPAGKGGRIKIKGTPAGVKSLLSGGGPGAMVNGGTPGSRETRNKVRVDASPSAVPRRQSGGARTTGRSIASRAIASEPQDFGSPYGM